MAHLNNLILFTSSTCTPCKILKSNLERAGYSIETMSVDDREGAFKASRFMVRSVPTVVNKKTMNSLVGNYPISDIVKLNGE